MKKRQEVLEFLELQPTATDGMILSRANEKRQFFVRLQEHAPNEMLKNIHNKNVERIDEILKTYSADLKGGSYKSNEHSLSDPNIHQSPAWLIRHTEQMSSRVYPLTLGTNVIGRDPGSANPIILDNDPYISRRHAIIEIANGSSLLEVYITDGVEKPSMNGVYINGDESRIVSKRKIYNGDTIQIGNTKLILRFAEYGHSIMEVQKEVDNSDYKKTVIINLI